MMNWVDLTWPMLAAASIVLGYVHALLWRGRPRAGGHVAFTLAALAVAALSLLELATLHAAAPESMGLLIRWMHVPIAVLVAAFVYLVHCSFGYGAPWLALAAVGLRLLALVLNFSTGANLNFRTVEQVTSTPWWGVVIHHPLGETNPWMLVAQVSNLLLLAYLAQTLFRGMRETEEKRLAVLVVCGGSFLLIALMMAAALLMALGAPRVPLIATSSFIMLVIAVSWQLSDLFRSRPLHEGARLRRQYDADPALAAPAPARWDWNASALAPAMARFGRVDPDEGRTIQPPDRRGAGPHGRIERDASLMLQDIPSDPGSDNSEEELLRSVLGAAPSALLLVDTGGRIRLANEQASRTFGYEGQSMAGVHVDALLPERYRAHHAAHRQAFAASPRARPMGGAMELVGLARDGREFCVEVSLSPLHLGNQLHIVAAVTDLTERKRIEREMAMEREALAHLSRVTMLGELSGSLAHELNQPLAAILSNAQAAQRMLSRNPSDIVEVQEILADIVENDRRAGQVISRLRGLLKKEYREYTQLSLNEVVQDSLRLMRNELLNRRVDCRPDLNPGVPHVMGDRVQLQQVLLNLIVNACDALPEDGERIVTVRTSCSELGVCTEVVDTGHGIQESRLEAIFTPFETTKPTGMGMGLAVCSTILHAHGGRIWAENAETGGARVCFDLPGAG